MVFYKIHEKSASILEYGIKGKLLYQGTEDQCHPSTACVIFMVLVNFLVSSFIPVKKYLLSVCSVHES